MIGHYRSTGEDPLARLADGAARLAWIKANGLKVDLPLPFLSIPAPVHGDPYQAARPIDPAIVTAFVSNDQAKVPRPRSLTSLEELGITASPALAERL